VISRLLQWVVTLAAAAAGFALGVNHARPAVYQTLAGDVRISIRAAWPGNEVQVSVPQVKPHGLVERLEVFHAPLVWKAQVVRLGPEGRVALQRGDPVALVRLVLDGRDAVLRSAGRSFFYGAVGAVLAALGVALLFGLLLGHLPSRLVVAVFALAPLLVAGAVAYVVAGEGVIP
jgi:hypothetical protein